MKKDCPKPSRGIEHGLAGCHSCGKVSPVSKGRCPRCGSHLHLRKPDSIRRTVAFLIAAVALYVPANLLPVMVVYEIGVTTPTTIVAGMIEFWKSGAYPIALVIFTASLLIPILKIVALTWLCAAASGKLHPSPWVLGKVYFLTELFGRWSMVDVFVVAILVGLVQVGAYTTIVPGPGVLAFASVVVMTMLAAMSFDPRLLWDRFDDLDVVSPDTKKDD